MPEKLNNSLSSDARAGFGHRMKHAKSYYSFHPRAANSVNFSAESEGLHGKQKDVSKCHETEELVRYMSKLPNYLERGKSPQEKALNVGVLDWRLLEKWQHKHKEVAQRNSRYSLTTSSNTSSFSPSEGSSSCSSGGYSCSPAEQRIHRPTLNSYLNAVQSECGSSDVKPTGRSGKLQNHKGERTNTFKLEEIIFGTDQSSSSERVNILNKCKNSDMGRLQYGDHSDILLCSKGKMKIQHGESFKARVQVPNYNVPGPDYPVRKDWLENRNSAADRSDSSKHKDQNLMRGSRYSFSGGPGINVCRQESTSGFSPLGHVPSKSSILLDESSSKEVNSTKSSSELSRPSAFRAGILSGTTSGKDFEKKKGDTVIQTSTENEPHKMSDLKMGGSEVTKVRNPSPTHLFGSGMGGVDSNFNSVETLKIPHSGAKHFPLKSISEVTSGSHDSTNDKSNDTARARSSHLRRLLDPLLKSKSSNSSNFTGSSERDSKRTHTPRKSFNGREVPEVPHLVQVKLDLKNCKRTETGNLCHVDKHRSSMVQAVLQVAAKNGLPVFKFAVENSHNILAATIKKVTSSNMGESYWIYTFFSVQEMKKRNGHWINQGGKDRNPTRVPHVIAEMKVTDALRSGPIEHKVMEFVLFSMNKNDVDHLASAFLPSHELVAIVLKCPIMRERELIQGDKNVISSKMSALDFNKSFQEVKSCSDFRFDGDATVILPGGHHGQPSKGEPPSLIKRWKSGGSCDCGGWDLGCRIRVLANDNPFSKRSSSTENQLTTGEFELFSQDEFLEKKPMFSLSPFKDGIFSIEFDPSLEFLQAFSMGIAALHGKIPINLFGGKSPKEATLSKTKSNQVQVEISTKYASYPPLSPVGRV